LTDPHEETVMMQRLSTDLAHPERTALAGDACRGILERTCFGHLAIARAGRVAVVPVRFAFVDGWAYFRADRVLRAWIMRSPWAVLAVAVIEEPNRYSSVLVSGGCYPASATGSPAGDTDALGGIVQLRDRTPVGRERAPRVTRTATVLRLHADEVHGTSATVPCPAGDRPYDDLEIEFLRRQARIHSQQDEARADDDGMAEAADPSPPGRRTRLST
jgi:nitroimidazol reductase NimA-like FMN-containing flavoprotein (pyridoxamine 5'-phosphate oxidase superfamily)